jgi:hypothetical protein
VTGCTAIGGEHFDRSVPIRHEEVARCIKNETEGIGQARSYTSRFGTISADSNDRVRSIGRKINGISDSFRAKKSENGRAGVGKRCFEDHSRVDEMRRDYFVTELTHQRHRDFHTAHFTRSGRSL